MIKFEDRINLTSNFVKQRNTDYIKASIYIFRDLLLELWLLLVEASLFTFDLSFSNPRALATFSRLSHSFFSPHALFVSSTLFLNSSV